MTKHTISFDAVEAKALESVCNIRTDEDSEKFLFEFYSSVALLHIDTLAAYAKEAGEVGIRKEIVRLAFDQTIEPLPKRLLGINVPPETIEKILLKMGEVFFKRADEINASRGATAGTA